MQLDEKEVRAILRRSGAQSPIDRRQSVCLVCSAVLFVLVAVAAVVV